MEKIIVYMPNWLGDVIMALPALRQIRKNNPQSHITVLTKSIYKDIYLTEDVDNIIEIVSFGNAVKEIRKLKFDQGFLFTNSFSSALIFFLGNVKNIIGYAKEGRSIFLSCHPKLSSKVLSLHQSEQFLNLVNNNLEKINDDIFRVLSVNKFAQKKADDFIEKNNPGSKKIIGFGIGAKFGSAKEWLPLYYRELAHELVKNYNAVIILFGTLKETDSARYISQGLNHNDCINLAGKTNIADLIAHINNCSMFIGNDSGLVHIAGALNKRTIAIFGSTSAKKTAPLGKNVKVISSCAECAPCFKRVCSLGTMECMKEITVEKVLDVLWHTDDVLWHTDDAD